MEMGEAAHIEMIAKPGWMVDVDADGVLDQEMQTYQALAMEQKFKRFISAGDATKLYEIIFHFLNINTLTSESKLYDEHFKEIRQNANLSTFIDDLRAAKNGAASKIVSQINKTYTSILTEYVDFVINEIIDTNIAYMNPSNIHYSNTEIYVLFRVKPSYTYEMWKIEFRTDNKLGSSLEKMAQLEIPPCKTDDIKNYIRAYNRANPIARIRSGNFAIAESETGKSAINTVSIIKDIVMLNKIFYERNQFDPDVLFEIQRVVVDKKTFPFKLLFR